MADAKCCPTKSFIGKNNLQGSSLETGVTHATNHFVPLLRRYAFALSAEATRQVLCPLPDFAGVLWNRRVPVPRPIRLCVAGSRMGLDTKNVAGVNPGLVKGVTNVETPALPAHYGLG